MKNAFVFYESFYDILQMLPSAEDWRMLIEAVCEYAFTGERDPLPTPALEIAFKHFQISIDSASARYDKAVEEGKKGGRPSVWIDRDEAEKLYAELGSWSAVADKMNVHRDTLRRARYAWQHQTPKNAEKPKNLNVSISDSVSVSESDAVAYSDSDTKRNSNKKAPDAPTTDPNGSPSRPATKRKSFEEMWVPPD